MKTPFQRRPRSSGSSFSRSARQAMASRIISPWDWLLAPALLSVALTVVLATAFQPFGLYLPEPVSPLVLAFAWPLIRPSYIAPVVLGALGFFCDLFWGAPLGFWTLSLLIVYGVLVMTRTYIIGQEWLVVFGVWVLTEFAFFILCTGLATLDDGAVPRLWGVFEQMLATTILFPFVVYLMEKYLHADARFS
jgi:rod shape-determining protein MreD